jgi:hypothetical protein
MISVAFEGGATQEPRKDRAAHGCQREKDHRPGGRKAQEASRQEESGAPEREYVKIALLLRAPE